MNPYFDRITCNRAREKKERRRFSQVNECRDQKILEERAKYENLPKED